MSTLGDTRPVLALSRLCAYFSPRHRPLLPSHTRLTVFLALLLVPKPRIPRPDARFSTKRTQNAILRTTPKSSMVGQDTTLQHSPRPRPPPPLLAPSRRAVLARLLPLRELLARSPLQAEKNLRKMFENTFHGSAREAQRIQ